MVLQFTILCLYRTYLHFLLVSKLVSRNNFAIENRHEFILLFEWTDKISDFAKCSSDEQLNIIDRDQLQLVALYQLLNTLARIVVKRNKGIITI